MEAGHASSARRGEAGAGTAGARRGDLQAVQLLLLQGVAKKLDLKGF